MKAAQWRAMKQLTHLLKPYRAHMVVAVILTFLPSVFAIFNPYLLGRLVDDGLMHPDVGLLTKLALLILFSKAAFFFTSAMTAYCLSALGLSVLVDYRAQLLSRILKYPLAFFDRMPSGRLTTRLTSDINSLQELFSTALVPLAGNALLIGGVLVAMFVLNWRLALSTLISIPLLVWMTLIFNQRIRRRFGSLRQKLSTLNSFAGESFMGARDLKTFNALPEHFKEFDAISNKIGRLNTRAVGEYAIFNPMVPFITGLMDVLILAIGGLFVYRGEMTVGQIVAFLGYATNFGWPIREFAEKLTVFQQALAAVDRLVEISDHDPEVDEGEALLGRGRAIEFSQVTFRYQPGLDPALKDFSFKVAAGEKIALLGETGSGKTTTCALLMRFYEVVQGQILIGGRPATDYRLDSYRQQIGWVSQDVFLFSGSLRDNIKFGVESASDQEIWQAIEWAQLRPWVENLPKGLDTELAERGAQFSSGQKQLISLARALLKRPSILIFDEATAYIDSATELQLQLAIEKLFEEETFSGTTGFFIAHRLSTLQRCDRLIALKGGQMVEEGSLKNLLQQDSYTRYLYSKHFEGKKPSATAEIKRTHL